MGTIADGIPPYDWSNYLNQRAARPDPDPVLGLPHWVYPGHGRIGRLIYDELRAIHAEIFPPRCTCSLGRCTIHPAEPAPEPPAKPHFADIAIKALLTVSP
jgi:glyoxylase-like metal-dependent hydrolase (beta-lactamase superfamily II)